jgi:hypothetical protein
VPVGEPDEDVQQAEAVFGGGCQVGADGAELLGSGQGAQAAGMACSPSGAPSALIIE